MKTIIGFNRKYSKIPCTFIWLGTGAWKKVKNECRTTMSNVVLKWMNITQLANLFWPVKNMNNYIIHANACNTEIKRIKRKI